MVPKGSIWKYVNKYLLALRDQYHWRRHYRNCFYLLKSHSSDWMNKNSRGTSLIFEDIQDLLYFSSKIFNMETEVCRTHLGYLQCRSRYILFYFLKSFGYLPFEVAHQSIANTKLFERFYFLVWCWSDRLSHQLLFNPNFLAQWDGTDRRQCFHSFRVNIYCFWRRSSLCNHFLLLLCLSIFKW